MHDQDLPSWLFLISYSRTTKTAGGVAIKARIFRCRPGSMFLTGLLPNIVGHCCKIAIGFDVGYQIIMVSVDRPPKNTLKHTG